MSQYVSNQRKSHEELYKLIIGQLRYDGHEPIAQMLQHSISLTHPPFQRLEKIVIPILNNEAKTFQKTILEEDEKLDFETEKEDTKGSHCYRPIFFTSHKGSCNTSVISHDGKFAATGSMDTSVKLLDVEMMISKKDIKDSTNPCRHTLKEHKQAISTIDFDFTGTKLASGSLDGTIKLFDLTKLGKAKQKSILTISDSFMMNSIAFHPSSQYILVGTTSPAIRLYDVTTEVCFVSPNEIEYHSEEIKHVTYSNDGKMYVSCSVDGSIKVWDGIRCITTFNEAHNNETVDCVRISRNQKYLLSSGRDNTLKLWDLTMGQILITYEGGIHCRNGIKAAFSHNEQFILGGNELTNSVIGWNTRTGEILPNLIFPSIPGHTGPIKEIATHPCVSGFLTANEDKTARFWHY